MSEPALGSKDGEALRLAPAAVVETLAAATLESSPPLGLGQEYRVGGKQAVGAALVVEDLVAHLAVFPAVN